MPRHPNKHIQAAVKYAQNLGWKVGCAMYSWHGGRNKGDRNVLDSFISLAFIFPRHLLAKGALMATSPKGIPKKLSEYSCEEYFAKYAKKGFYHPTEQYWFVDKVADIEELIDEEEDEPLDFLSIGGPGVDGIRWGYRKGNPGIWSWTPITGKFARLADSIDDLLVRWEARQIKV